MHRRRTFSLWIVVLAVLAALGLAACTSSLGGGSSSSSSKPGSSSTGGSDTRRAQAVFDGMSASERVGQVMMGGVPVSGANSAQLKLVKDYNLGGVILTGVPDQDNLPLTVDYERQHVTVPLQTAAGSVPLFIGTDQEGGKVQRLRNPQFSPSGTTDPATKKPFINPATGKPYVDPTTGQPYTLIPSALRQGGLSPARLRSFTEAWGQALNAAGINTTFAPVVDVVPQGLHNPTAGAYDRQLGSTPEYVAPRGAAIVEGLRDVHVAGTLKHFPGQGRVTDADPDFGVSTDNVTTRHDPFVTMPYAAGVKANVPFVMVGLTIYNKIDPGVPAAFSKVITTDMLRGDLKFQGIAISDDLGDSVAVKHVPTGDRAVRFIQAGGTMVLTVDAARDIPAMHAAVLAKYNADPAFHQQVDKAALMILQTKQRLGVL
jgi:beta-N-acetylhexosaminidase